MKSFGFTQIREGIGSTHRGILGTYTTNFGVNNTSSQVEYGYQSRGYKLPKALYIHENDHKVIEYGGHCRIITQQGVLWSTTELMRVSVLYQRKKERKGIGLLKQLSNSKLKCKGIIISKSRDQKQSF